MTLAFRFLTVSVTALALTACTDMTGMNDKSQTGAAVGALTGAAIGNAIGKDTKSTVIGGAIGAVIGGSIGTQMEIQEAELRASLAGTGADITNDGSRLLVVLPESVTFPTNSSVVNSGFYGALANVADSLRRHPNSRVTVVGHTDNVGTEAYNLQLSTDRALAVARILIADGTSSARITYSGRGEAEPVASNSTSSGRAMNRRVEIIITPTG